ncbi:MAG TPA: hypothetical protein VFM80_08815 [Gracilimonas sp.]|uniref:hypothetical protein n=1 Tax=Gracilimonas sp. TaxID=1974203 RepID=UPI002DA477BE|nr:hypothetical protein [Gracilimonas sp.]
MAFLISDKLIEQVSNIIHRETQKHPDHLDLTVAEVHRITGAGSLDFGGSEFKPAATEKLTPEKQKTEDDYGWWKLGHGPYKIISNERVDLPEKSSALITPHQHASKAGLVANSYLLSADESNPDRLSMNVTVSEAGCNIKENARVAELRILEN